MRIIQINCIHYRQSFVRLLSSKTWKGENNCIDRRKSFSCSSDIGIFFNLASGWARGRRWFAPCLLWRGCTSPPSSSSTRSTLCSAQGSKTKIKKLHIFVEPYIIAHIISWSDLDGCTNNIELLFFKTFCWIRDCWELILDPSHCY